MLKSGLVPTRNLSGRGACEVGSGALKDDFFYKKGVLLFLSFLWSKNLAPLILRCPAYKHCTA